MEIFEKKVSMTELFFDLIFVWATAKMTHMLHHLHNGIIEPIQFLKYLITFISWVNIWMIQTVFNNRYSDDDIVDQFFMYFNMFILLILVNYVSDDFEKVFYNYNNLSVIITVSQLLQYFRQLYKRKNEKDHNLIKYFMCTLGLKATIMTAGSLLPYNIGGAFGIAGILVGLFSTLFYVDEMKKVPVNFPNLVERVSLLVIITFGETMLSITSYFKIYSYLNTFLCFAMVTALFFYYKMVFMEITEHHNPKASGATLLYSHYFILLGINLITISINSLTNLDVNTLFIVFFLYCAFFIFYFGIFLNYKYNKKSHQYSKKCIITHFLILLVGLIISLIIREKHTIVLIIAVIINIFAAINIWKFHKESIKII